MPASPFSTEHGTSPTKNNNPITMGLTTLCNSKPKRNQIRLSGGRTLGRANAVARKTPATPSDHQRGGTPSIRGQRPMAVKRTAKTIPNERSEDPTTFSSRTNLSWVPESGAVFFSGPCFLSFFFGHEMYVIKTIPKMFGRWPASAMGSKFQDRSPSPAGREKIALS